MVSYGTSGGCVLPRIAVVVPCLDEEATVSKVVSDFRRVLPAAEVYVYDNGSSDRTAELAAAAGAHVRSVPQRGKGRAVRAALRELDADAFVLVDGDDTYPAEAAPLLLGPVLAGEADMVVGDRISNGSYAGENKRAFHGLGNSLVCSLVNRFYGSDVRDIMTGYRAFSAAFAATCPVTCDGFEVETEMTVHALDKRMRIAQVPVDYRDRPPGSSSKLDTFADGLNVLTAIAALYRDCRPLRFFGAISLVAVAACLLCGVPVLAEYAETRYITHVPLAIAAVGAGLVAALSFASGVVLDAFARSERRRFEVLYMAAARDSRRF